MERLLKAQAGEGFQQIVPPGVLRFLDFARLNLVKGQKHSAKAQGREYVLDIFSGRATVTLEIAYGQRQVFSNVGARTDVFSGPPVMVYLPPQSSFEITAASEVLDAGIFSALSTATAPPMLLEGAAVVAKRWVATTGNAPSIRRWPRTFRRSGCWRAKRSTRQGTGPAIRPTSTTARTHRKKPYWKRFTFSAPNPLKVLD